MTAKLFCDLPSDKREPVEAYAAQHGLVIPPKARVKEVYKLLGQHVDKLADEAQSEGAALILELVKKAYEAKWTPNINAQGRLLLLWLQQAGSISTQEARDRLMIMSPACRVLELRRRGYNIPTVYVNRPDILKRNHRQALYVLMPKAGEGARS